MTEAHYHRKAFFETFARASGYYNFKKTIAYSLFQGRLPLLQYSNSLLQLNDLFEIPIIP
jgi:hypothetical protein